MSTSPTTRLVRSAVVSSVTLVAVLGAACAKKDNAADSAGASATAAAAPADTTHPAAAPAAAPAAPNDAQIAHVAVTANSIDSTAGALAKQKGTNRAVKDFGNQMMVDHGGVNKQAVALATKLHVTPEDNDISRGLKTGADQNMSNLQGKTGADFDKAYIDHEVDYHQAVLDALDKTLIPSAQNAELKTLLEKVRPNVAAHLAKAKSIQSSLAPKS